MAHEQQRWGEGAIKYGSAHFAEGCSRGGLLGPGLLGRLSIVARLLLCFKLLFSILTMLMSNMMVDGCYFMIKALHGGIKNHGRLLWILVEGDPWHESQPYHVQMESIISVEGMGSGATALTIGDAVTH